MTLSNRQIFLKHVGQTSSAPVGLEISHAEGIYLFTPGGKKYIDLVSGVSVSNVGHRHPAVIQAVKSQVDKHMHLMVYGEMIQSAQTAYAEWIAGQLPANLNNIYYVSSGSEAIDGALKLAKRSTGRPDLVAFKNAYHGSTHGALSILGDSSFHSGYLPLLPGVTHLRFNDLKDLSKISTRTAAVVVEPIQAEAGIIEPENNFLKELRERCNETGTLLIFDEIQTGFGRTGRMFGFEHYNVVPDIICFAKSFGGGMPLGAFVSSKDIMEKLTYSPPLGHITTFGGHPVSCAAGLAAQKYVEENDLTKHAAKMELRYRDIMTHPEIIEIRGKGLFLAVKFSQKIDSEKLMKEIFNNGLIVDQFLFCRDAFRIAPPLTISREEVDRTATLLLDAFEGALK